jgi:molybdate transport system permease protein
MAFSRDPDASPPAPPPSAKRWSQFAWSLSALPLLAFFVLPILLLLLRTTPAQLIENLQRPEVLQAIGVSLRTTSASLLLTLLFGTPLAYRMGRGRFRYQRLVDTLIDLPTVLPPSVAGLALLITFGRKGLLGGLLEDLGLQIAFTQAAVVLAQVFVSSPFFVRAASLGFAAVDPELIQAAQLDGAGRWQTFRYVILPLSRTALVGGAMMSWARALGEFGATMIFAGNFPGRTQTMPTAIYLGFEIDFNLALTISVILLGLSFAAIGMVKWLTTRPS